MLTIEEIKNTVARVGKKYNVERMYLFGSYAKGMANNESDVDLIVDDGGSIKGYIAFNGFRRELMEALGKDVDLLTPNSIGDRLFSLIKNDRILLYER